MSEETTESLESQVDRLAKFIVEHVPGEPSQSEGAIDTAIRVMGDLILTSHVLVPRDKAKKILGALMHADQFFQARETMNSHLSLGIASRSPLASMVALEHRRMEAFLVDLKKDPGQESGS